jgi:TonB-linked SusC/RagA family outer membrane protein
MLVAVMAVLPLTVEGLGAQGVVTGRVMDAATNLPLADAQVRVVGSTRGSLSNADGRYTITGVATGSQTVRAQRIGYSMANQVVSVTSGTPVTVNFGLRAAATTLDQVVISATGQTQRKRESGATSSTIDSSLVTLAAAPTFSNILTARAAGVAVQGSSGTTGTSSRIRIRGANSITLSNDPLLIVDGVRMSNEMNSATYGVGGMQVSRFDDINPEDIENIEVIKGPAASSLYGTAAANGVIQITTKRGRAGKSKWNAYTEYGTIYEFDTYPTNYAQIGRSPAGARLVGNACRLDDVANGFCIPNADSLMSWNPVENVSPFRDGDRRTFGLNVSGGSEAVTYYVAGEMEREQGVYDPSRNKKYNFRTNLRAQFRPNLDGSINVGWVTNKLTLPQNDNNALGAIAGGLIGKAFDCSLENFRNAAHFSRPSCGTDSLGRGYFTANVPSKDFFLLTTGNDVNRFIGGLVTNWSPLSWLRGNAQVGVDYLHQYDYLLTPPNKIAFSSTTLEGSRSQARLQIPTYNASTSFTASKRLPWQNIESSTSLGAQYTKEEFHRTTAFGAILLAGTSSLNGTSARFAVGETNRTIVTMGAYAQQQFSFRDRLFLTAALRGDDGSTFGQSFSLIKYPAISASWVASEESFFPKPDWLSQLRLRLAYGQSGQRPGFRDPETFFNPVAVRVGGVEVSGIAVGGTGNAELKPERSAEIDGGFDASFLNGKLGIEFSAYTRKTDDALVSRLLPPSLGATTTRLDNLGTVRNKGVEALINATLVDMDNVRLETTITGSSNRNEVVNLGQGITPIFFGFSATQVHRNGYPLGAYFARKIVSFEDLNGDGIIGRHNCPSYGGVANPQIIGGPRCEIVLTDSAEYFGGPLPTREANFNTSLTVFRDFRISTLFNYRGGYNIFNSTREFRCGQFYNCQDIQDRSTPLADQAKVMARLMGTSGPYIEDADFVKLRELAFTYTVPRRWASMARVDNASITVAGRNLATWTDYTGFDPEVNSNANAANQFTTSDFLAQPPVRMWTVRFNLGF